MPDALLDAACVVERRIYLLFPADVRLTLLSQQVRALQLVEALREQDWMANISTVAVVGGGVSGMAASAALKVAGLREDLTVTLLEKFSNPMPLQTGCHDKLLAPYLIDWPRSGSDADGANLPILDWKRGAAATVALDINRQFERFKVDVRRGAEVKCIRNVGNAVEIDVEGDNSAMRFDLVIVAVGFGLEDHPPGVKKRTNSYWRVNPAQQPPLGPMARRRILISGLGDGGLIDFVLFACSGLTHEVLCQMLCESPDAQSLFAEIDALEERIWAEPAPVIDIAAAYLAFNIDALARSVVLPWLVRDTDFTLITRAKQLFEKGSAPINRLAAALVIRAIEIDARGNTLRTYTEATLGPDAGDQTTFSQGSIDVRLTYDEVVIRHGDTSASAWDFNNSAIRNKVADLRVMRSNIATRPITPRLCPEVAEAIESRLLATMPTRVRLSRTGAQRVRWYSDLSPDDIGRLWRLPSAILQISIDFAPVSNASKLELALCRLVAHAEPQAQIGGTHRQAWVDLMAEVPRRAGDQTRPGVLNVGAIAPDRHEMAMDEDQIADHIEASLDEGLVMLLGTKVRAIVAGTMRCPVDLHDDIKVGTFALWDSWVAALGALSSEQRRWVIRLFGGLLNDFGQPDSWSGIRVGPKCVDGELLPAILFHLAMQHLLGFGPAEKFANGNVGRPLIAGSSVAPAHICGTRWAVGSDGPQPIDDWEPRWAAPQWYPSCLILPTRNHGFLPKLSMTRLEDNNGMLMPDWTMPPIIYNSPGLRQALRLGRDEAIAELEAALKRQLPRV
jgi:hypothetical protein